MKISKRKFGIEIEYDYEFGERTQLDNIRKAFIKQFPDEKTNTRDIGYYHSKGQTWDFKTDSSVNGENPFEIASPILSYPKDLNRLCKIIEFFSENCSAPSTGGLHLHMDVTDFSLQNILNIRQIMHIGNLYFKTILPKRRSGNGYCPYPNKISIQEFNVLSASNIQYPRDACNLQRLRDLGTVEIRLGASTTDWNEIYYWICFWMFTLEHIKTFRDPVLVTEDYMFSMTLKDFCVLCMGESYPDELYDFFYEKIIEKINSHKLKKLTYKCGNKFIDFIATTINTKEYLTCAV